MRVQILPGVPFQKQQANLGREDKQQSHQPFKLGIAGAAPVTVANLEKGKTLLHPMRRMPKPSRRLAANQPLPGGSPGRRSTPCVAQQQRRRFQKPASAGANPAAGTIFLRVM